VATYDVSCRMEYNRDSLSAAVRGTLDRLPAGSGGMIGVDSLGNWCLDFNCGGMFRGKCDSEGNAFVGIWEEIVVISVL
jgi:isoaspartyl peptidase/L-asparaginase-like protein (Ntn-hydrolase superfamily)